MHSADKIPRTCIISNPSTGFQTVTEKQKCKVITATIETFQTKCKRMLWITHFPPPHLTDLNSEDQSAAHRSHDPALIALRNCCLTACYDPWCEPGNITTCGSINNKPSVVPMCLRKLNSSCSKCRDLFCANYPLTLLFKLTFANACPINTAPFTGREAGNSKKSYGKNIFSRCSHFGMAAKCISLSFRKLYITVG